VIQIANHVALIACSHGLGHIRRMSLLARALIDQGIQTTIFAPKQKVEKFSNGRSSIKVIDFDTGTSVSALRTCADDVWTTRLPSLDKFDLVVSDNLLEILNIRPDAILSGSFLWHDALEQINPAWASIQKQLLKNFFPTMLTSSLFAMPEIHRQTQYLPLPLFGSKNGDNSNSRDILIASGRSGEADHLALDLIQILLREGLPNYRRAHIEPSLFPDYPPKWMVRASFDDQMYRDVTAAIIRPGIGAVSDALLAGCRIFPFYETGNLEMAYNAKRIHILGLGTYSESLDVLFKCCMKFLTSKSLQTIHRKNLAKHVQDNGEIIGARFIGNLMADMRLN